MNLEFYRQVFEKSSNITLYENPSMWTDRWADTTKLTVFFPQF